MVNKIEEGFTKFNETMNQIIRFDSTLKQKVKTFKKNLFRENNYRLLAVNFFAQKLHHRCLGKP